METTQTPASGRRKTWRTHSTRSSFDRLAALAPPLAALAYPWLVGLGPGVHPVLLGGALAVPVIAFVLAHHRLDAQGHLAARRVAFLAVAAPALFTLIGGWMDGQRVVPFKGLTVWILLWCALAAVAVRESGRRTGSIPAAPRPALRTAHGISATFIAVFALIHLGNHLAGLLGASAHLEVMRALRSIYRSAFVEPALLACIAFQMVSGASLLWRATTATTSLKSSLQLASGAYMLCFFASHLSAVFRARHLRGIETDWHWLTASPLLTDAWSARLVPYYWLGVIAIGIHAASGLRYVLLAHGVRDSRADRAFAAIVVLSVLVATAIMVGMVSASHSRQISG